VENGSKAMGPTRVPRQQEETDAFERETLAALDSVYRFALQLTQDPADSDDLVQDTFLRAYKHRHQYQLGTNCTAWLFTICRNLWMQKRHREERILPCEGSQLEELASVHRENLVGSDVRRLLEVPEFDSVLQGALDTLPETYRTPVVIVDVEDQTYRAAAEILGVPIGTVRSRLFRGRRLLQDGLMAYAEDAGLVSRPTAIEAGGRS
jgi:RNA polymerase sigma-70 factor (ECF subfamily)